MQRVSEEQNVAIQHILNGHNVVLDAVAGSGKSTTILSLAQMASEKRILQLTYNAMLRKEIQTKIKSLEIGNIKVHTFHSLAVRYYLKTAHTDTGIRKIIMDKMCPVDQIPKFDIIVLDEAQDMSFLYFQLMAKFGVDMGSSFQLFVLGDFMQGIYEFKGADIRSLTQASIIWLDHPLLLSREFRECTLKTTYRCTRQMARFLNDVMLGEQRLEAVRDGPDVVYMRHKSRQLERMVLSKIDQLLASGASPGDFFIIATSVKGVNSNIRKMENALAEKGIPCYVPTFDMEGFDDKVIEGKVVFSTYHSVKGRERKYVFVMGFDQSYFWFADESVSELRCPNALYVACTRATEILFVLEKDDFSTDRPLAFLQKTHHQIRDEKYADFKGDPRVIFYAKNPSFSEPEETKDRFIDVSPTELVKYIPEHILEVVSPLLETVFIQEAEPGDEIEIPNIIMTSRGLHEDVSALNGIAIPSMYYDHLFRLLAEEGKCPLNIGANILKHVINNSLCDTKDHEHLALKRMVDQMPDKCDTASDYLRLANLSVAAKERLLSKWNQIGEEDYTWITNNIQEECLNRLDDIIGGECEDSPPLVEHRVIDSEMEAEMDRINAIIARYFVDPHGRKIRFSAISDLITSYCIWEIKCTGAITIEHRLQLILYDWLWRVVNTKSGKCLNPRKARLVNIKTGEILRLNAEFDDLTTIVVELLRNKCETVRPKTNEEFLADCSSFLAEISRL